MKVFDIPYIKYSIYDILYIMDRYVIDIIYSFIYGWNPYKLLYSYLLKKLNEVLTNYKISMIFVGLVVIRCISSESQLAERVTLVDPKPCHFCAI